MSKNTLAAYRRDLTLLARWLGGRGWALDAMPEHELLAYFSQRHASTKATSANRRLTVFKRYFRWALREHRIEVDPTLKMQPARQALRVPKTLTEAEVEALLAAPDTDTVLGMRDRTMLELMYASGLRVSELVGLRLLNISLQEHVVRVFGKGNKERLVPFGEEAGHWITRYLSEVRPELLGVRQTVALFVTSSGINAGSAMSRVMFWSIIKKYALQAGIATAPSPHTLRHAFATHLLNHGADLRALQMLLGHSSLSSTQIYTLIAKEGLKKMHRAHHPRG